MIELNDRTAWLHGGAARCSHLPAQPCRPCRLVLLGAPGSGKGTQAEMLCHLLGACHLSTGDVFRAAKRISDGEMSSELEKALRFMRRGELVPDGTVLKLVQERGRCMRCGGGFVLDGFPRTVEQAAGLEQMLQAEKLELTGAIYYKLSPEAVIARLSGRRVCPSCGSSFHLELRRPRKEGACDHCGAPLIQREDDQQEAVLERLRAYEETAAPLLEFYRQRGLLTIIDAEGSPDEICQRTIEALPEPALAARG